MKNSKNIGIIATVVLAIGMVGFNFSDGVIGLEDNVPLATLDGAVMSGHLEIIQTDAEGNIKSYQQTDNAIMNIARNCVANMLFGRTANTACDDTTPGVYSVIGLNNGTAFGSDDNTKTSMTGEISVTGDGLFRSEPTTGPTVSQQSAASGATGGAATTRISAQFTYTGTQSPNTISSAGLFNSTTITTNDVFAIKDFASPVALSTNDLLTVNWDISISGTDDITQ